MSRIQGLVQPDVYCRFEIHQNGFKFGKISIILLLGLPDVERVVISSASDVGRAVGERREGLGETREMKRSKFSESERVAEG